MYRAKDRAQNHLIEKFCIDLDSDESSTDDDQSSDKNEEKF